MLHPGLVCRTFVPQAGKQLHASPLIHSRSTKYRLSRTERCYHQPVYNSRGTTSMNYRNLPFGRVQTLTATGRTTPTGVLRSLQAHQRRSIGGASQRAKIFKEKYHKNKETQARRLKEELNQDDPHAIQHYPEGEGQGYQQSAGKAAMGFMAQFFLFGIGVTLAFVAIGALFGPRKVVVIERDERPGAPLQHPPGRERN